MKITIFAMNTLYGHSPYCHALFMSTELKVEILKHHLNYYDIFCGDFFTAICFSLLLSATSSMATLVVNFDISFSQNNIFEKSARSAKLSYQN